MKMERTSIAVGVACVGACAVSLGLGGAFIGMTVGGIAAFITGEVVMVSALAAALTGAWYWYRKSSAVKAKSCECVQDGGCNTGDTCDFPAAELKLPKS